MTYRILTGCLIYTHRIISFMRMKKMSTIFTKKSNPVTGKLDWVMQDENYDFHQEVARSAFADMLHDEERNRKYYEGIRLAVEKMHTANRQAHVLDIGTGTGLLSMMAAACGADTIVACESFKPVAACAEKVIAENGFADKIHLVPKRSTELVVGEDGDMKHRANILVTEIFDTELIGEGALSTFKHAHDHLLEKDCIVVPSSATIYAQVVQSETVVKWNKLLPFTDPENGKVVLDIPSIFIQCPGAAAVHDIQLNQLSQSEFVALTDPVPVFKFDWLGRSPLKFHEASTKTVNANQSGTAQGIFLWWDLVMDMEGQVILSCAPSWAHPDKAPAWRDHWMQAVYYLPESSTVTAGEAFELTAYHDEYSLWFSTRKSKSELKVELDSPVCSCCLHLTCSRTRVGMMNDTERRNRYVEALRPLVKSCDTCLCLGEASLLGLLVARLGVRKVYCVDENSLAHQVLQTFLTYNKLQDCVVLAPSVHSLQSHQLQQVTLMLSEPHFNSALLPWQNLYFWYQKKALAPHLCNSLSVVPRGATIWAMAVEFAHLWKIRAPLHSVEGFRMNHFDMLIENSRNVSDSVVEPQPLWEYPCRALSKPFHVLEYNFLKDVPDSAVENSGSIPFGSDGNCHAVALWMEWDLDGDPKHTITTGPVVSPELGNSVRWDMHTRQGVYFFPRHHSIVVSSTNPSLLFQVCFQPHDGDVNFSFKVFE